MGYRIKTISELLGVPRNTLLAWERRYSIVEPVRQANGYREYSEADLERLRAVKRFLDRGHRISEAISLSAEAAVALASESITAGLSDTEDSAELCEELLSALLALDRAGADHRLRQTTGISYQRRLDGVFMPLLRETGLRWEAGELTVAQEHYISSFCRDHLTAMLLSLEHGPSSGPVAVCASWSEDHHDLALLGVSIKLALKGHRVVFLGARMPHADLLSFCDAHQPAKVC
ncbi:MAG: DNA-binding transcriptional MerR regulator, partial [Myxococcota bacterium]